MGPIRNAIHSRHGKKARTSQNLLSGHSWRDRPVCHDVILNGQRWSHEKSYHRINHVVDDVMKTNLNLGNDGEIEQHQHVHNVHTKPSFLFYRMRQESNVVNHHSRPWNAEFATARNQNIPGFQVFGCIAKFRIFRSIAVFRSIGIVGCSGLWELPALMKRTRALDLYHCTFRLKIVTTSSPWQHAWRHTVMTSHNDDVHGDDVIIMHTNSPCTKRFMLRVQNVISVKIERPFIYLCTCYYWIENRLCDMNDFFASMIIIFFALRTWRYGEQNKTVNRSVKWVKCRPVILCEEKNVIRRSVKTVRWSKIEGT